MSSERITRSIMKLETQRRGNNLVRLGALGLVAAGVAAQQGKSDKIEHPKKAVAQRDERTGGQPESQS